jgi:glyoxylase-like metal-dependent hydrolase (beta-lactamase superfamily II)
MTTPTSGPAPGATPGPTSGPGRPPRRITHDQGFVEVADRCFVARYEFVNVNVGLVAGRRGLLVVDTHASEVEARRVLDDVRRLGLGEVVAVLNTHAHFDHTLGNAVFVDECPGVELYAHEEAAAALPGHAAGLQAEARREVESGEEDDPRLLDIANARVVVPGRTFSSAGVVDLGDRYVELAHLGRGHTAGDAVVRVPDADMVYAGDLVEELSDEGTAPGFGDDCYPLDWPATLDLLVGMLTQGSVIVPGHGSPVDRAFVEGQRSDIAAVAQTISDLAGQGVPAAEALAAGEWPFPAETLEEAVRRGYEQLPAAARSLPLA